MVLAGLGYDRRGGSYKVGLTAAGGSHVNAHSLTPTLASVPLPALANTPPTPGIALPSQATPTLANATTPTLPGSYSTT